MAKNGYLCNYETVPPRCVFGDLIGRLIEAYVDDIVVKSKKVGDLIPDLTAVFEKLREHGVKLNPEKCVFGSLLIDNHPYQFLTNQYISVFCSLKANLTKS